MLPTERGDVLQQPVGNIPPLPTQMSGGAAEIDGVPVHDGADDQIEAGMPRTFAYVRVSTMGQTTENQLQEIEAAGFQVEPRRIITETVSGSTAIVQRRGFSRLMDKLEAGDILIVTKLDRLKQAKLALAACPHFSPLLLGHAPACRGGGGWQQPRPRSGITRRHRIEAIAE